MDRSLWFNARVLCCEADPQGSLWFKQRRARVSWAPLQPAAQGPAGLRRIDGDWADPDFPYRAVEGHEVLLLRWPTQPAPAEQVRWWVSAAMHLGESARRSRVRALGLGLSPDSPPLLATSAAFLAEYLGQLELPVFVADRWENVPLRLEQGLRALGA